ncbi:MAG: YcxB family protein [Bacteroidia bacterium]|nr:YcxB family protein [Bacteroidia bacterium]
MTLKYKLSPQDYIEFNWYIHWSRPERAVMRTIFRAAPFVLVLLIILFSQLSDPEFGPREILFLIPAVAFSFFGPKYMKWRMSRTILKKVEDGGYVGHLGERELQLSGEGVRLVTEKSDDQVSWAGFRHWHEAEKYIFMFLGKNQALMVPKKAFSSAELSELTQLLQEHIQPKN